MNSKGNHDYMSGMHSSSSRQQKYPGHQSRNLGVNFKSSRNVTADQHKLDLSGLIKNNDKNRKSTENHNGDLLKSSLGGKKGYGLGEAAYTRDSQKHQNIINAVVQEEDIGELRRTLAAKKLVLLDMKRNCEEVEVAIEDEKMVYRNKLEDLDKHIKETVEKNRIEVVALKEEVVNHRLEWLEKFKNAGVIIDDQTLSAIFGPNYESILKSGQSNIENIAKESSQNSAQQGDEQ